MNHQPTSHRTVVEHLLGKYLVCAGEIDMFITMSQSYFTGKEVSNTWLDKSLAEKLKWYNVNLDPNIGEHATLLNLLNIFDTTHRLFRNTLAHSALSLDETGSFNVLAANGSTNPIPIQELQTRVNDLIKLKDDINEALPLAYSASNKPTN